MGLSFPLHLSIGVFSQRLNSRAICARAALCPLNGAGRAELSGSELCGRSFTVMPTERARADGTKTSEQIQREGALAKKKIGPFWKSGPFIFQFLIV